MGYFSFSSSYRSYNEDRVVAKDNFGFILDGANNLGKQERLISDSTWFVDEWKSYLLDSLGHKDVPLKTIVKRGIEIIRTRFEEYLNGQSCEEFPSCSMCIYRINRGELEYFIMGDTPLLIETIYGDCYEFIPEDTRRWSTTTRILLKNKAVSEGIDMVDAKRRYTASILASRKRKNTSGDFHIVADYPLAVEYATVGSLPTKVIKKFIILSDGLAEIYFLFKDITIEKLLNSVKSFADAEKLYKRLLKLQRKDYLCNKYLRLKRTDDSSLLCFEF